MPPSRLTSPMTVRLDAKLHRQVAIVAAATDCTLREMVECGLRREVAARMEAAIAAMATATEAPDAE